MKDELNNKQKKIKIQSLKYLKRNCLFKTYKRRKEKIKIKRTKKYKKE